MGLAYQTLSTRNITSPFQHLVNSGEISEAVFSFKLNSQNEDTGGELILGGYDEADFTGPLRWLPVVRKAYWEVSLEEVGIGPFTLTQPLRAIIDTGTSLLTFPNVLAEYMNTAIGAQPTSVGLYHLECSTLPSLPTLKLRMGGYDFELEPEDYVIKYDSVCVSAITGLDLASDNYMPMCILGDTFLRKHYSVFDFARDRVGLALAKK